MGVDFQGIRLAKVYQQLRREKRIQDACQKRLAEQIAVNQLVEASYSIRSKCKRCE